MTKSFFTHFSAFVILHAAVLVGTWQLGQSELLRTSLNNLGPGVLKLQIASRVLTSSVPVLKKRHVSSPKAPAKSAIPEEKMVTPTAVQEQTVMGSTVGISEAGMADALSLYKAELRAIIDQNKYYPTMSRRLGQTGTVVVAFTLLHDGHIINVRIDSPSQYERLNSSALDAVKKVERFKPIPKEVSAGRMDIKVPVKFVTI